MPDETRGPVKATQAVADKLDARGHKQQAEALRAAVNQGHHGSLLRAAVREACQIVLTAIEAIDPVSATMVEELRLEVDSWADTTHHHGKTP